MKLGPVSNCRHCEKRIMICQILGGKWIPFSFEMIEAAPDAVDAYVPISSPGSVILAPIADVAPRRLAGVRWYAQRHRCTEFFRSLAAKRAERVAQREHVDSLAAAIAEYFGAPEEAS